MSPESLIAEITAAFDGVQREEGTTLHEGEELDCGGSPEEIRRARRLDNDTRWQDVPDEWIGEFPSAFRYMDPKGLRYYLPAVMIWHFKHTHWSEPASADALETLLTDTRFGHRQFTEFFNILSEQQRRATARWLFFNLQDGNEETRPEYTEQLLASPWGKYLSQ